MQSNYKTSLYIATIEGEVIPRRYQVRAELCKFFNSINNCNTKFDQENQIISFKGNKISFRVLDSSTEKIFLLSFQPLGNISMSKDPCLNASEEVLNFCDSIGSKIKISTNPVLMFSRYLQPTNARIDISFWEVICPYVVPQRKISLVEFRAGSNYSNVFSSIPKEVNFQIFSNSFNKSSAEYRTLRDSLSAYGTISEPNPITSARQYSMNLAVRLRSSTIFIFLETDSKVGESYETNKIFFASNLIPTQYINTETVNNKLSRWKGVNANLILEILTKIGKKPVILQAPEEIFTNDGFLCLSDIDSAPKRLFGAIFSYTKQGLEIEREEVQIYDDLNFKVLNEYTIDIDENNIDTLTNRVGELIGKKITIDILLTRRWSETNIQALIKKLSNKKISVEKIYYISNKTSRFVDEYLLDASNYKSLSHPFTIIGKRIAFLKACTELRIFPNLFSLFIELQYPENGQLTQGDLEKILWLSKKRIYRIQEFSVLKSPEPIYVFKNMRKKYIAKIDTRLRIPLRLLI